MKIRNWDTVVVMSGKDSWKIGTVQKVFPITNKVLVEGVNIATRHIKKQGTNPGQIIKMEKAIDASNVALVCPITDAITKIGYVEIEEKGTTKKFRYSKKAALEKGKKVSDCVLK